MIENQASRLPFILALLLLLIFLLAGCQADQISAAFAPRRMRSATPTPFQAQPPTLRPTYASTNTPRPTATRPGCDASQGRIEQHQAQFQAQPMAFRVYLPPCYGQQTSRYPVVYLLHGQTFSDDQWDRLGAGEAADTLILSEQVSPFIIVMPREADTFDDIFLSPFSTDLIDGLIPWIDANYQTCAERACRAIGGLSRGGAWALRLGLLHWDLFAAIGLHSTPPFIGDANRISTWIQNIPPNELPLLYLDTGKRDWYIGDTSRLEEQLTRLGVPHEWYLFNGTHEEAYWSSHVIDYLTWYSRAWKNQMKNN